MKRIVAALALALFALPSLAATLYVTEIQGAPPTSVYYQAAKMPAVANQTVSIGVASAQSSAFNSLTGLVRLHADIACHIVVGGTNPTATATSMRFIAGQTEYFVVKPGDKVAVIIE
jgi:hypothetical protein